MVEYNRNSKQINSYKLEYLKALYPLRHHKVIEELITKPEQKKEHKSTKNKKLPNLNEFMDANFNPVNILMYTLALLKLDPTIMRDKKSEPLKQLLIRYCKNTVIVDELVHKIR